MSEFSILFSLPLLSPSGQAYAWDLIDNPLGDDFVKEVEEERE